MRPSSGKRKTRDYYGDEPVLRTPEDFIRLERGNLLRDGRVGNQVHLPSPEEFARQLAVMKDLYALYLADLPPDHWDPPRLHVVDPIPRVPAPLRTVREEIWVVEDLSTGVMYKSFQVAAKKTLKKVWHISESCRLLRPYMGADFRKHRRVVRRVDVVH